MNRIPNKVLSATFVSSGATENWLYDDGSNWWDGGSTPRPYKWIVTFSISVQQHSSPDTREPYEFNGLDVFVGDWIGTGSSGETFKIVELIDKSETEVTVKIEDLYRYNTFNDKLGKGGKDPGFGSYAIFNLSDEGMPLLDPFPSSVLSNESFASIVSGRFRRYDTSRRIELTQPNHNFKIGDVVSVNNNNYELATSDNTDHLLGAVVDISSDPSKFSVTTNNKIIKNENKELILSKGQLLYVDKSKSGSLSTTENGSPIYLAIISTETTRVQGNKSLSGTTLSLNDVLNINGTDVTFASGLTPNDIMNDINGLTSEHGVVAETITESNVAVSNTTDTQYGLVYVGSPPPGSITINGQSVIFDSIAGGGSYGTEVDAVTDINEANIPNISAELDGSKIKITNSTGGAITVVNTQNDSNGALIAGTKAEIGSGGSATGIPLNTPASTGAFIILTHPAGLPITLKNKVGTPKEDLGIWSVDNGRTALLMTIGESGKATSFDGGTF